MNGPEERWSERPAHRSESGYREAEADALALIDAGIALALERRTDIDQATARLLAYNLGHDEDSQLRAFGRGEPRSNADLRDEYLPIYNDPETPDEVKERIDWLGAYLVARDNRVPSPVRRPDGPAHLNGLLWQTRVADLAVSVRADLSTDEITALGETLQAHVARYGDAFAAFLTLPDIDASSDELEFSFTDSHLGSFSSQEEAMRAITELDDIERALQEIAQRYLGGEHAIVDMEALWEHLQDVYEVIEEGDAIHVFNK